MILSAQAVSIANAVKRSPEGALHVVIADNKKQAYYLSSDLDNFFLEENLFFFPATSEKSEYKKNTALLQRTAALSALTRWDTSPVTPGLTRSLYEITPSLRQKNPVPSTIVVTYTEAVSEKVIKPIPRSSSILLPTRRLSPFADSSANLRQPTRTRSSISSSTDGLCAIRISTKLFLQLMQECFLVNLIPRTSFISTLIQS